MISSLKKALQNVYTQFTSKLTSLFSKQTVDEETLRELEKILISADTGVQTTRVLIHALEQKIKARHVIKGADLKVILERELKKLLVQPFNPHAEVYLLVGVNGSGKTTFAAKLAGWLQSQHKKVLLVAGDTFRAAASEQLSFWAKKLCLPIVTGKENQDPSSVIFDGCVRYKDQGFDCLIIDTAGRLQTKTNLMKELEKIKKTITKQLPEKKIITLLTIDAMLGQNSFDQATLFHECTPLDGIVLTKMDGTGKGGIVFAIAQALKIPIAFISFGEQPGQLALFSPDDYIARILDSAYQET